MLNHCLLITICWLGSASLQYINTGGPGADTILDPLESTLNYPLRYMNYFTQPTPQSEYETFQNDAPNDYYQHGDIAEVQRKRRTTEDKEEKDRRWLPNLVDMDKTLYKQNDEPIVGTPFMIGYTGVVDENSENSTDLEPIEKKSFSPWGGKRDKAGLEHMWTWKRATSIREPSMPKRVRFSPWGGKRSGQMIYKPGSKGSKLIFSTTVPELTRIVSNYSPAGERFNLAGFQFIPSLDNRHPIKILALSTKMDGRTIREALPFKTFIDSLPKMFKPGHPYTDVNLKKDGKRKVKFSAWGGKRSPPIIGPIWTPTSQNLKESTLETILLLRNNQDDTKTL